MIDVNVNEQKRLDFSLDNLNTVKKAKLSVITPNNILFTFPASIDYQQNKIFVDLPILKNIFRSEIVSNCHLETVDKFNRVLKSNYQKIRFHSNLQSTEKKSGVSISLPYPNIVLKKIHREKIYKHWERSHKMKKELLSERSLVLDCIRLLKTFKVNEDLEQNLVLVDRILEINKLSDTKNLKIAIFLLKEDDDDDYVLDEIEELIKKTILDLEFIVQIYK